MPKPKNTIPSIEKTICLPEDLVCKVDLKLYSELEQKVPFGAWKKYIVGLIQRDTQEQVDGEYWKRRCEAAEDFINKHPADQDLTAELWAAYKEWLAIVEELKI